MLLFFGMLYPSKIAIARANCTWQARVLLFTGVLVIALAYLYIVIADWHNNCETRILHWLGVPVDFLTIPAISFTADIFRKSQRSIRFVTIRSLIEVFILTPLWFIATFFVFGYLGWFFL